MTYLIRGHYKFDNLDDRYADAFRDQRATLLGADEPQIFDDANDEVHICNDLSAELELIPKFENNAIETTLTGFNSN